MKIIIEYDPISREVSITENDFTIIELFGILESAKAMAGYNWMAEEEDD